MSKKPKTITLQARVDARDLATIARAFVEQGLYLKSKSHLQSLVVEIFCSSLVDNGIVERIDSTEVAVTLLDGLEIGFRKTLKDNVRALSNQISVEKAIKSAHVSGAVVTQEKIAEALDRLRTEDDAPA